MPGIFISYRREDSAGHAGRLFDRLSEHFGHDHVFMDVSRIEPGVDFVEAIDRAVSSCDVLLVIIGRAWVALKDASGIRRLDDANDFIRLEAAVALKREIRVIPVLVQGARMPAAQELPTELQPLARRQAVELSDARWSSDVAELIRAVEKALSAGQTTAPLPPPADLAPSQERTPKFARFAALAFVAVAVLASALWYGKRPSSELPAAEAPASQFTPRMVEGKTRLPRSRATR